MICFSEIRLILFYDGNMERSEYFQEKIDRVRGSESEYEVGESKERQAKLLRMEMMLATGQAAQLTIETLSRQPMATIEQVKESLETKQTITHPEALEAFIEYVVAQKQQINTTLEPLRERLADEGYPADDPSSLTLYGQFLVDEGFSADINFDKVVLDLSHPLVVVMYVGSDAQFDNLVKSLNLSHLEAEPLIQENNPYFPKTRRLTIKQRQLTDLHFPILMINRPQASRLGSETASAISHVESQATHQVIQASLEKTGRQNLWGSYVSVEAATQAAEQLVADSPDSAEQVKVLEQRVLSGAFGLAKNYLLEYYASLRVSSFEQRNLTDWFTEINSPYDALAALLPDNASVELQARLRDRYLPVVRQGLALCQDLRLYAELPVHLYARGQSLYWVLAQIPLEQWSNQIDRTLFREEIKGLQQCDDLATILFRTSRPKYDKEINEVYGRLITACKAKQHQPLFQEIAETKEALNGLAKRLPLRPYSKRVIPED